MFKILAHDVRGELLEDFDLKELENAAKLVESEIKPVCWTEISDLFFILAVLRQERHCGTTFFANFCCCRKNTLCASLLVSGAALLHWNVCGICYSVSLLHFSDVDFSGRAYKIRRKSLGSNRSMFVWIDPFTEQIYSSWRIAQKGSSWRAFDEI